MSDRQLTNQVRKLRFLAGEMTQEQLGNKVGVTRQTIAAIESEKYSPTLETAFRIADALGKDLDQVFTWS